MTAFVLAKSLLHTLTQCVSLRIFNRDVVVSFASEQRSCRSIISGVGAKDATCSADELLSRENKTYQSRRAIKFAIYN